MESNSHNCVCGHGVKSPGNAEDSVSFESVPHDPGGTCRCAHSESNRKLRDAILDAIGVLEHSKKAFKSQQLEALRKRLTCLLAE